MNVLLLLVLVTTWLGLPVSGPGAAAAGGGGVRADEVCFRVHNDGDSEARPIYAVRYFAGRPSAATPVIVLVHGVSPAHEYWDTRPDASVARDLATAGYLVIAYDRLGWGRSPYRRTGGGRYLTLSGARSMLHEIVGQVEGGAYSPAQDGSCEDRTGDARPAGPASATVVVMGADAAGAIIDGYPGRYHDVAGAIPVVFSNQGFSDAFTRYTADAAARGYASGSDYFRLIPDEASCRTVVLYEPGVRPDLAPTYCHDGYGGPMPVGELTQFARLVAENRRYVPDTGPDVPVLLVFADHDFLFPADAPAAELAWWRQHCHCDVTAFTQAASGHALPAHAALPALTPRVVDWLRHKGLGPR